MATELKAINPVDIAGNIESAWAEFLRHDQLPPSKRSYVYASSRRECERRMVLEMTDGDKMPGFPPETLANFRRGKDRERDLLADLKRIGRSCVPEFEVIGEQQRFELRDRKGRVAIVGKVDARLLFLDGASAPLEVKSWNPMTVAKIKCFDDLLWNPWTKAGAYQLLSYLFGANEPYGFLLLDRAGIPRLIPVELYPNLHLMEEFLTKAESALDHKAAGTLPDFIQDASECKRCPFFGALCNPPIGGAGAVVLSDPDLEAMLERREELTEAADEYDILDKLLKQKLRGIEMGIAGKFLLEGKWQKQTSYDIPESIKAQYKKVDPKGKFVLTITKV